nr:PTS transporter subunit EIIB [Vibrio nigripulchritudo]
MSRHENLTSIDYCITRLRLILKNRDLADDYSPSTKNASKLSHVLIQT